MILTFKSIDNWPVNWKRGSVGKSNPFRGSYSATLEVLDRELQALGAKDAFLQIDLRPDQLRLDGQPRADGQANYRGVILTIDTRKYGVLTYPCDTFESRYYSDGPSWQANLRAIALGLESLRKVERYGIAERGQQYAGFAQIGSGTPLGISVEHQMTEEEALMILSEGAGLSKPLRAEFSGPDTIQGAYRLAVTNHHPDKGGDPETFRKITEARDLLVAS